MLVKTLKHLLALPFVYLGVGIYRVLSSEAFGHLWVVFRFVWRILVSYIKAAVFFGCALVLIPWQAWQGEFGESSRCCRTGCHSCPWGYKKPTKAIISFVESL